MLSLCFCPFPIATHKGEWRTLSNETADDCWLVNGYYFCVHSVLFHSPSPSSSAVYGQPVAARSIGSNGRPWPGVVAEFTRRLIYCFSRYSNHNNVLAPPPPYTNLSIPAATTSCWLLLLPRSLITVFFFFLLSFPGVFWTLHGLCPLVCVRVSLSQQSALRSRWSIALPPASTVVVTAPDAPHAHVIRHFPATGNISRAALTHLRPAPIPVSKWPTRRQRDRNCRRWLSSRTSPSWWPTREISKVRAASSYRITSPVRGALG